MSTLSFRPTRNLTNSALIAFSVPLIIATTLIPAQNYPSKYFLKIDELLNNENGDYDSDFLVPSTEAITEMKFLIKSLYQVFGEQLSIVKFIPNGKGGVEAMIRNKEKLLHLVVPADKSKPPYLFQKEGSDYGIKRFSKFTQLENWFNWVLKK